MSKIVIHIDSLSKKYRGSQEFAVENLSLTIVQGEIFGLLGPNGAGKTTLISMLCGLITPSEGTFTIHDFSYHESPKQLKASIGVVPQDFALYPSLTAKENLCYFGSMYGLKGKMLGDKADAALASLGLAGYKDKQVGTFSGGMKRRINLLAAVLHEPAVLFLDEPTVGVDVHSKKAIMGYLLELNAQGTTIVYTSHHLQEAQEFCTRVGIIESGKLWRIGSPEALIASIPQANNLEDVFIDLTGRGFRDG
ncbi:ABC transporter ATP-binding protein [Sphingobacterium griseoflavum]|uniref:ABC transporter ATP-binding protein n=1 Tax=Sphingobacterium griseoflavum TaxID=1474952 RepID=A0ABQ3HWH1_9SPHI|nr:ABC transporter ATP-binding protein [Sphingobacterium griseoflavum]GHE40605.1 ABC transporter ATP-binding protein [Sphingobacterium griseoflavum]